MSFRGRSFRPRPFSRPPRGGRGAPRPQNASGNFRYPRPESFSGRPAPSSQDDYVGSERRRFEDREHFRKVRPPDEQQFHTGSHARESADNDGRYSGNASSYYGHTAQTIDYDHRHGTEVDEPSKAVAVEKAMQMAQRTREMISKLGSFKQTSQQSEAASYRDSSLQNQPSASVPFPERQSSETNATPKTAPPAAESAAINKIRQNTSLLEYAFKLPVESEVVNDSGSSLPSHDAKSSWSDTIRQYGSDFETPVTDHSREYVNRASYEDTATSVYSQQNTWGAAPTVTQETTKSDSCDPTIANILKSIGFNFEMSNMMQNKSRKETTSSSVGHDSLTDSSSQPNKVPLTYEVQASRYLAEQRRQYGMQEMDNKDSLHSHVVVGSSDSKSLHHALPHGSDDTPFSEDMFKQSPPGDFKLKFKSSEANAGQKPGALYEDFSDSDDDFAATARTDANASKTNAAVVSQTFPGTLAFGPGNEGVMPKVNVSKTADDLDWEMSTEQFIRKLQQPRSQQQRTVSVGPKSESAAARITNLPPPQSERVDGGASENQGDSVRMSKSFVPLDELKTIRKTIFVSETPSKTELSAGKSDPSRNVKNIYAGSSNREKSPKLQQRNEDKANSSSYKKKRGSDHDEKDEKPSKVTKLDKDSASAGRERQKKIDALVKELENLKRQQNILMRRKKRESDGHKDPFLVENSKLQEEICNQIAKLRKASQQAEDNSCSPASDQFGSKDEADSGRQSRSRSIGKSFRSVSPDDRDSRNKSAVRNVTSARPPRVKRINIQYEYFDGGNHFCRCCNCFSVNIFEHCQHLISSAHQQNVDPFDKPWLKLAARTPAKPTGSKGKVTSARVRGVEFLMSTQAFYCSLCDVFLGSCTCAETHCKSDEHNSKYTKYLDENPYYERRLELEKSSSSAVTGKPLPSSMQLHTSSSKSAGKDVPVSLADAVEKAKQRVHQMVKRNQQEMPSIDSKPPCPTHRKSRVVPKSSSGVLAESTGSRRHEDDSPDTSSLDDGTRRAVSNAESGTSVTESQKTDAEPPEASRVKKPLPFIGKLPCFKSARGTKLAASEQNAADDKSKIEIKVSVSQTASVPVESEPALSSDAVVAPAQQEDAPVQLANVPQTDVEYGSKIKPNSLDAFLSIGDPESGQCQAVPVFSVGAGPQTRSEFMLENKLDEAQTAEAGKTSVPAGIDAEQANTMSESTASTQNGIDVAAVPNPSLGVDAGSTVEVAGYARLDTADEPNEGPNLSTGNAADQSQADAVCTTGLSTDTGENAGPDGDQDNSTAMSIDADDDNTEDYEQEVASENQQVAQVPRDEETAKLLPQISAAWMEPPPPGTSDGNEEAAAAMICEDFEILDECDADD